MDTSNTSETASEKAAPIYQGEKSDKELEADLNANTDDGSSSESGPAPLSRFKISMLVFALSMAGFLYTLDVSIIVTAIPKITSHFHTIQDIGWYGSAYLITLCACTPTIGKIYQFYNPKFTFLTFIAIFEVGSLICGAAPSSAAFVIGRAVLGIGGSGIFNGALTIIGISLPKEKRAQTVAFVYAVSMVGTLVGPIIGGLLTEKATWRWCFYLNLPAGAVVVCAIAFITLPDMREKTTTKNLKIFEIINRIDPIGFLLFAPACVMILLALQFGGSKFSWNSSQIIGLFVGFGATLATFISWEWRRGETAMLPLHIMRRRIVYSSCVTILAQFGSQLIFTYYLPVWFQTTLGVGPILSGAYFMATAVPLIVAVMVSGVIMARVGNPTIFTLLGNAIAIIGNGLMTTFTPSTPTGVWIGYQIIGGLGRGMTLQQPINAVQQTLDPALMAVGTSIVVFCQFFGGAFVLALAETDFGSSLESGLKQFAPGVNATLISDVGATGIRGAISAEQLPGVLKAYNMGIVNTFYLGTGMSALAFLAAWGMGFQSLKTKKEIHKSGEV